MAKMQVSGRSSRQKGAALLEFAFVFPLLLMLSYGTIVYSYTFVVRQAMGFAASEAARSALSISPLASGYDTKVLAQVQATATSVLSWLPAQTAAVLSKNANFCPGGGGGVTCPVDGGPAVVVTISIPVTKASSPLFTQITIPGVGAFPPLPATMTAAAVARI